MACWGIYKGNSKEHKYHVELSVCVKAKNKTEAEKFVVDSLGPDFGGGYSIKSMHIKSPPQET